MLQAYLMLCDIPLSLTTLYSHTPTPTFIISAEFLDIMSYNLQWHFIWFHDQFNDFKTFGSLLSSLETPRK